MTELGRPPLSVTEWMDLISQAARANRTVLMTARELDGSIETREVEPYSLRRGASGQPGVRLF
jgi:predicted DNA-binding transcriptional regulator YafY